jgi:hypothetical protein
VVIASLFVWVFWLGLLAGFHFWSLSQGRGGFSPVIAGGDDGEVYLQLAKEILAGEMPYLPNIYPYILAFFIKFAGIESIFFFKLVNLFVTMLCSIFVILIVRFLVDEHLSEVQNNSKYSAAYSEKTQIFSILMIGIYPSLSMFGFSYSIFRDGWVFALFSLTIFFSIKFSKNFSSDKFIGWFIAVIVSITTLYLFRWYLSLSVSIGWCIYLTFEFIYYKKNPLSKLRQLLLLIFFILAGLLGAYCALKYKKYYNDTFSLITYRDAYHSIGEVGSNMGIAYGAHPWYLWPGLYLRSFLGNCFGPFPWQVSNLFWLGGCLEGIVIFLLFLYICRHIKNLGRTARFLAIQTIVWLIVIAFFNDNIGTALRLRVPAVLLLIALGATLPLPPGRLCFWRYFRKGYPKE